MVKKQILERWWIWLIPAFSILAIFYLYPLIDVIRLSFTNAQVGSSSYSYGMGSWISVLTSVDLLRVIYRTLIFVLFSVLFQLLLGLIVALLINTDLPGALFVKLSMVSAWVVPGIITGVIWRMMYSSSSWGIINYMVKLFGFGSIPFLYSPGWALFSVTLANIWRGTGFSGIMQYAALKAIPKSLYEAAEVDGATKMQRFFYITLPLLKPMILINMVLITIYTFNTYDSIYSLTKGGPGDSTTVMALATYREVYRYLSFGKGAVYAVIMLLFSLTFTFIYYRMMRERT